MFIDEQTKAYCKAKQIEFTKWLKWLKDTKGDAKMTQMPSKKECNTLSDALSKETTFREGFNQCHEVYTKFIIEELGRILNLSAQYEDVDFGVWKLVDQLLSKIKEE